MRWSIKLGTIAGIGIYMHLTFLLLIAWVFVYYLGQGKTTAEAVEGAVFVIVIFGCVVLHELGHALTARRYNIRTRDITLLPIGGVARLERMPENPVHELWVALAGPAVNVVIAGILFAAISLVMGPARVLEVELVEGNFFVQLMWVNAFLVGFNLLPAFPMDGGRVLRAFLAINLDYRRATNIAARIGQTVAILFGVVGLLAFHPLLILIAVFVYFGAQEEARVVELNAIIRDLKVSDAMLTRFRTLSSEDPLSRAVEELLAGSQQDFPVMDGETVAGILRRNDLVRALSNGGTNTPVGEVMCRDCKPVDQTDSLRKVFDTIRKGECSALPVLQDGRLVGLLTLENIGELIMVDQALHGR